MHSACVRECVRSSFNGDVPEQHRTSAVASDVGMQFSFVPALSTGNPDAINPPLHGVDVQICMSSELHPLVTR